MAGRWSSTLLFDVKASSAKLLGKAKVCGETYSAPALSRGRFYVRDENAVYCYDLPTSWKTSRNPRP